MFLSLLQQLAKLVWQLTSLRGLRYAERLSHTKGLTTLPWKGPNGETVVVVTDANGRMLRLPVACTTARQYMRLMDEVYGVDPNGLELAANALNTSLDRRAPMHSQIWS